MARYTVFNGSVTREDFIQEFNTCEKAKKLVKRLYNSYTDYIITSSNSDKVLVYDGSRFRYNVVDNYIDHLPLGLEEE